MKNTGAKDPTVLWAGAEVSSGGYKGRWFLIEEGAVISYSDISGHGTVRLSLLY